MIKINLKQSLQVLKTNRTTKYLTIAIATLCFVAIVSGWRQSILARNTIHVAMAAPLSGDRYLSGEEMVNSVRLYFNRINQQGGINGRPLKLLVFDDWNNPITALSLTEKIAASPAVAVLGHLTSSTSMGTAQIYKKLRIPAITGTASSEVLTQNNPYYFRTTFTNDKQGQLTALYAKDILNYQTASIIYADNSFGASLYESFQATFNEGDRSVNAWSFSPEGEDNIFNTVDRIIDELITTSDPGIVFLAMDSIWAKHFLVEIQRKGVKLPIIGNDTFARKIFPIAFEAEAKDGKTVADFISGIKVPVPIVFDSGGTEAQAFASDYQDLYRKPPTYVATGFYNAAKVLVRAIDKAEIDNTPAQRQSDRDRIRDSLEAINNPDKAVNGLNGALYFDGNHNTFPYIRFGQYVGSRLISAPLQLNPVSNLKLVDLEQELTEGNIVAFNTPETTQYFWKQDVVYTGIDVNKLTGIDQTNSTFSVDFYLWMRYLDDSDIVTSIEFPEAIANSSDPNLPPFDPDFPERDTIINGNNYRLYRINAQFKENFDFRDYPFDRQKLNIYFQNVQTPSDRLIYVVDTFGLQTQAKNKFKPYQALELWQFKGLQHARETFATSSTRGNPLLFDTNIQVDYPGLAATVILQRRFNIFLVKTLLPLGLLVLVLYSTLYFSKNLAKERLTVAISALLSSAVLLTSINAQLADAGYTVAIEYGFYIFFSLCLFCILVGLGIERIRERGHKDIYIEYLNYFAKVFYIVVVLSTVVTYAVMFGDRLA